MEQNNNNNNNEEILHILQLYLDELEYVKELGEIEEAVILDEYVKEVEDKQKKEKLKKMLIESNLRYAMSFATNYLGKGIDVVDIIAEINLSLTSTINSFTGGNLKEKIETEKQIAEKTRYIQRIPKYVGGTLMWPVPSSNSTKWITAFFGAGASQGYPGSNHSGVDIAIPRGEVRKT